MAFYDIFEQLCANKGVTPTKAGRENGVKQGTVSMWKKRGTTPNPDTLSKLASYFDVPPNYLLNKSHLEIATETIDESSKALKALEDAFSYFPAGAYLDFLNTVIQLSGEKKKALMEYAGFLRAQDEKGKIQDEE